MNLVFAVPDLGSKHGGVQRFLRLVLKVLQQGAWKPTVVSLKDTKDDVHQGLGRTDVEFIPCGGRKWLFTRTLAAQRDSCLLFGHLYQAVIGLALSAARRARGYGIILHGVEAWKRQRCLTGAALARADFVLATTPYTASVVVGRGVPKERVEIVPLALEPDWPVMGGRTHSGRELRGLSVCRLERVAADKGIPECLEAVKALRERGTTIRYDIVGDGNFRPHLEEMAKDLGLQDVVTFHGHVSDDELQHRYEAANVFILPSKREGFGIVFLEAMASGLPIVGCEIGGATHVVRDSVNAISVPYESAPAVASALEVLADPMKRNLLGRSGLAMVQTEFSYEHFARRLESVLVDQFR